MKKLILLLLLSTPICAEPGPATQYLINEPASLFDIGMLRLKRLTDYWEKQMTGNYWQKSQSGSVGGNVNVHYRPEDDKIYVSLTILDELATEEQMEAGCRYALRHMGIYLTKSLHTLFWHKGYRDPAEPPNLRNSLEEMFELRCAVLDHQSGSRFWASRKLGAGDITIGQWKMFD